MRKCPFCLASQNISKLGKLLLATSKSSFLITVTCFQEFVHMQAQHRWTEPYTLIDCLQTRSHETHNKKCQKNKVQWNAMNFQCQMQQKLTQLNFSVDYEEALSLSVLGLYNPHPEKFHSASMPNDWSWIRRLWLQQAAPRMQTVAALQPVLSTAFTSSTLSQ